MAYSNIVIKGRHYSNDKIKFTGKDTRRILCWKCSGNTYREIYNWLVDHEVITRWDIDPVDKYLLNKLGKTYDDYTNEDDEIDFEQLYKDGEMFLTDEAYREIISNEQGNAYYQEWEVENDN